MQNNPFREADKAILAEAGTSGEVAENLLTLCDDIGPRFTATDGYRRAAEYMRDKFRKYGLDQAELEAFEFTAWRKDAPPQFIMQSPRHQQIACYALPYGASTGPAGIEAEVVDVGGGSPEEIAARRQDIAKRFVLITRSGPHRMQIYAQCAEHGAAGFILCNTVEGMILATGTVADADSGSIPAISITRESAQLILRRVRSGPPPRFRMVTSNSLEPATTWNVLGELTGTDFPGELVLIGGHLDSHDIGPGAFDNAAGAVLVMEVARLLAGQRRHLKRSVRFIGFAGEEIGLLGSHYHAKRHADALQNARFMLNCDTPALGEPKGLAFHKCPQANAYMASLSKQMAMPLVCQNRKHRSSDHYPFILQGLPTAGIASGKFSPAVQHFAHMAADTPDKVSVTELRDTAAFAARFLLRAASDDNWPDMRRNKEEIRQWQS